jgi:putative ABC transport system substrate-binding protein
MRRREFITLLGGTAAIWPLALRAQHPERMWRIGVLMIIAETESEAQTDLRAFRQGLGRLGWEEGKNINVTTAGPRGTPTGYVPMRHSLLI